MFKKKEEMTTKQEKTVKTKLYTEDEIIDMILQAHHNLADEALDKDASEASMSFILTGIVVVAEVRKIMDKNKGVKHEE